VVVTPCPESIPLSEITGARIFCKLDNLQRTGSFKERGARNALLRLSTAQKKRGVIAASAGNHALGLAYHGKLLGIPVTVVMPDYAPLIKITTCQKLGARVILRGRDFAEARAVADGLVASDGLTYVHGFDAPDAFDFYDGKGSAAFAIGAKVAACWSMQRGKMQPVIRQNLPHSADLLRIRVIKMASARKKLDGLKSRAMHQRQKLRRQLLGYKEIGREDSLHVHQFSATQEAAQRIRKWRFR